ncbi:M23 family metallopeptidase [uncultured Psychrobacter sp.]|uniref:M23 family metallopeptidase n=1 Tax=uncultured Psychrobacter sp. TaxID=259303 RepID=UPI00345A3D70
MSSLIKPVQGVTYTPDRVGYIRAVSRKESGSDLRYSYTYTGDNKEAIKVDNPTAVSILNPWNYVGLFQFSEEALQDVGCYRFDGTKNSKTQDWGRIGNYWTGKFGAISLNVFKSSGTIQMKAINEWINRLCRYSRSKNLNEFYGSTITGAKGYEYFEVTESGVIAAIHLKGSGAVKSFLTTNGKTNESDANGTSIAKYMNMFAHYDIQTCCKRKVYVKIVNAKKVGIPNKEVEISSEYKGKFNLGKIVVTHKTDKDGNLPVIVRHPNAKIQLKIDGKLVETIVQKSDQVQGYEIVYLGKHNYSSVLLEHEKLEATQESTDSNSNDESTSSDQPNKSTTDNNTVDEVTFNIKLVEGDTGKPLPNTTYHLEYKNNIKPHKTDSSGIESGITADISQSIGVYLDDDDDKKQSVYSMAFPVTEDLKGQTKVLKVPVVSFSIKFVDDNNQPIPHYEFKTLYRGRQSAIKRANNQGISTIKALVGQKLTVIDGQDRAQTTAIVSYGSKQWTMIIGTDITREDISDASDILNQDTSTTLETSEQDDTPKPQTEQDPVLKVKKPKVTEVEKKTETGPTLEVASDEAKITIKFIDEATNKSLSGLSYITQSTKYGKNTSVTGNDGTRGRTHDSLVGVDITVLVYEDGKEVEKDVITASADRNGIPYVYKAKKPETTWCNPLDSCIVRTARLASRKSATYGKVRNGGTRNHQGVDFRAVPGVPIKAVAEGKVIVINESYSSKSNFGAYLVLECELNALPEFQRSHAKKNVKGNKVWFFYAHLSQINTKYKNKKVSAGTVLGKTGASGNARGMTTIAKGAHLHFEARHVSTGSPGRGLVGRFDPLPFFPKIPPA